MTRPYIKRDISETPGTAAYFRAYRKLNQRPKKRHLELDRSKPVGKNVKLDKPGYMRQYMRWVRAQKAAAK